MIYLILIAVYILIGGLLHGIFQSDDNKDNYTAAFIWPIAVFLSLGEWIGQQIKRIFNLK